jgi:cysteine-rich repeat protein
MIANPSLKRSDGIRRAMAQHGIRFASALIAALVCCVSAARAFRAIPCSGDCDGSDRVAINELVLCVNIALGTFPARECPACDRDGNERLSIGELILAVSSSLGICHFDVFSCCGNGRIDDGEECDDGNLIGRDGCTPDCRLESCPLTAGTYTLTQAEGGAMRLGTFIPWPLPAEGALVVDVAPAEPPECVHHVVVPFPDGFVAPTFCIPATALSVRLMQIGCGVGLIDSNGGADYTITEIGDTSDGSATCALPNPGCPPGPPSNDTFDSSHRVDIAVGNGIADQCSSGRANVILGVPVRAIIWSDRGGFGYSCPAEDGTYDPDTGDLLVAEFSQILDFTTDSTSATWRDLDGDGCALAGMGPPDSVRFSGSGVCLDLEARTVTTVAAGPVGSGMAPLQDITAILTMPHTLSGPEAPLGATCAAAPAIDFRGLATRCLE